MWRFFRARRQSSACLEMRVIPARGTFADRLLSEWASREGSVLALHAG